MAPRRSGANSVTLGISGPDGLLHADDREFSGSSCDVLTGSYIITAPTTTVAGGLRPPTQNVQVAIPDHAVNITYSLRGVRASNVVATALVTWTPTGDDEVSGHRRRDNGSTASDPSPTPPLRTLTYEVR